MASLRLVSINIERAKHYNKVFPFLIDANPDVICIQELYERDIPKFERELGGTIVFYPAGMQRCDPPETGETMEGHAILSRLAVVSHEICPYSMRGATKHTDGTTSKVLNDHPVIFVRVEKDGVQFDIGTTHFTWTPNGQPNDAQRADTTQLLTVLKQKGQFVLTGDFNAPRGGETFSRIASVYTDNIPPEYVWSLDLKLHRNGGGKIESDAKAQGMQGFMVDGIFSTSEYAVSNVRLQDGLSDHCALVARIDKN